MVPLRIRKVEIKNVGGRTRPEVVEQELAQSYKATTAGEVYVSLGEAAQRLHGTGAFKSVNIMM